MRPITVLFTAALALFTLAQGPLQALSIEDRPMTADEFERFTTGKTLNYATEGSIFGTEYYKPGRKVMWAFTKEECHEGRWYPQDEAICFAYDDLNGPQCWKFFLNGAGLWAQFIAPDGIGSMAEVSQSVVPLSCMGPEVGV